jgi:hypothetical protein
LTRERKIDQRKKGREEKENKTGGKTKKKKNLRMKSNREK